MILDWIVSQNLEADPRPETSDNYKRVAHGGDYALVEFARTGEGWCGDVLVLARSADPRSREVLTIQDGTIARFPDDSRFEPTLAMALGAVRLAHLPESVLNRVQDSAHKAATVERQAERVREDHKH